MNRYERTLRPISRYLEGSFLSISRKFIMVISKQDLIGLPTDTGCCDATHQVRSRLLNNIFAEHNGPVGVEQRVTGTRDSPITRARGETVHDRFDLRFLDVMYQFDLQRGSRPGVEAGYIRLAVLPLAELGMIEDGRVDPDPPGGMVSPRVSASAWTDGRSGCPSPQVADVCLLIPARSIPRALQVCSIPVRTGSWLAWETRSGPSRSSRAPGSRDPAICSMTQYSRVSRRIPAVRARSSFPSGVPGARPKHSS